MKIVEVLSNKASKSNLFAVSLLVLTALFWSTGGMLIKLVSWNPIAIAGSRSLISALMILVIIKKPKFHFKGPHLGAIIAYSSTVTVFVMATKLTTAANAILLQYTAPIYIAIFGAWILKEKTQLLDWITIASVIGGMVLFFVDNLSGGSLVGNLLAILSGICFAMMFIFTRKIKDEDPMNAVFWGNVVTFLVAIPFMSGGLPDARSLVGIVLLGVFQLGLSYFLYTIAIKHVTALEAILITVLEPILNPVWVLLFIGEKPTFWAVVGGSIVVFSILVRNIIKSLNFRH